MSQHTREKQKRRTALAERNRGMGTAIEVLKGVHQQLLLNAIEIKKIVDEEPEKWLTDIYEGANHPVPHPAAETETAAKAVGLAIRAIQSQQPGIARGLQQDLWATFVDGMLDLVPTEMREKLVDVHAAAAAGEKG